MSTLGFKPDLEPDTLTARPYQADAIDAVRDEFRKGVRRTMIVHATGLGKSITIAKVCRYAVEKGNRVLVVVHMTDLVTSIANQVERVGITPGIEMGGVKARANFEPDVVVGSLQSLQGRRLASWPRDYFQVIIVDECHHRPAPTYQQLLSHFGTAREVGFTATPDRADGEDLMTIYESVAHEMDIIEGVTAPAPGPYLSRPIYRKLDIAVDLRKLRPKKGDYTNEDIHAALLPHVGPIANKYNEVIEDRSTIIFVPLVITAQAMASALQSLGRRFEWIDGVDPERASKLQRYAAGDLQGLVCANLLTEGVDVPRTACVGLCRPTKSRALFSQMIGRGLRPGKPNCLIVDFAYLTEKHDLVRPADLFERTPADRRATEIANQILADNPGLDVIETIEKAKVVAEREARDREVLEMKVAKREVRARRDETVDPIGGDLALVSGPSPLMARHERPSEAQIGFLRHRGFKSPENLSKRYATKLIGAMIGKERKQATASPTAGFFDGHA
jgi:superfamily II DNA or RNA helicase